MQLVRDSLLCGFLLIGAPALAADASDWALDIRSAVRLIAASAPAEATQYRVGVELRMDPGWHTYWRYPGDSGVPPKIDFSDSENVSDAKVFYPAPQGFTDESGIFIGYRDHVIYPVHVTPRDSKKPVKLKLDLFYAVCDKLCVPASGHTDLTITPGQPSGYDDRLAKAEAAIPKRVSQQQAQLSLKRITIESKPAVELDIATDKDIQVFAEGPTAEWALPIPKPVAGVTNGARKFRFELDGLPSGTDPKAPLDLTFTIVGGEGAIETSTHLD